MFLSIEICRLRMLLALCMRIFRFSLIFFVYVDLLNDFDDDADTAG